MTRPNVLVLAGVALVGAALLLLADGSGGEQPPAARDRALASELGIALRVDDEAPVGGPPPEIADASAPSLTERSCLVIAPAPGGGARVITLPLGGALLETAPGAPAAVRVRRFAARGFPVDVGRLAAGRRGVIEIPADGGSRPWQLQVRSAAMISVCGRGAVRPNRR